MEGMHILGMRRQLSNDTTDSMAVGSLDVGVGSEDNTTDIEVGDDAGTKLPREKGAWQQNRGRDARVWQQREVQLRFGDPPTAIVSVKCAS
jgi:hypothetical protein